MFSENIFSLNFCPPPNICDPNFCAPIFMTSLRRCLQSMTLREVELKMIDRSKWEGVTTCCLCFRNARRGGGWWSAIQRQTLWSRSRDSLFNRRQRSHSTSLLLRQESTTIRSSSWAMLTWDAIRSTSSLWMSARETAAVTATKASSFPSDTDGAPVDAASWKWEKLRPLKWQIFMSHCYRVFLLDIFYCNVGVEIQIGNFQIGSAFEDFQLHLMPDWLWLVLIMCWIFMSSVDAYSFCLMNDAVWLLKEYLQLLNIRIVNFCSLIFRS